MPGRNKGKGYRTLFDDQTAFKEVGQLPFTLNLQRFDDGNAIYDAVLVH